MRVLAFTLIMLFAGAVMVAGDLGEGRVTPGNATENSIYTIEVTWTDSDDRWPLGAGFDERWESAGFYDPENPGEVWIVTNCPFIIRGVGLEGDGTNLDAEITRYEYDEEVALYTYWVTLGTPIDPEMSEVIYWLRHGGYPRIEPVLARFDPDPRDRDSIWRTDKVCYLSRTPLLSGAEGFVGVFTSPDPDFTDPSQRVDLGMYACERNTGKVYLDDSVVVTEPWGSVVDPIDPLVEAEPTVYYAFYQLGPIRTVVRNAGVVHLAEKEHG